MRLINADAFIEYLGLDIENAREENIGEIVTLEDFDRQPTAYDVDKVAKQIRQIPENYSDNDIDSMIDDAVEIVKCGGIE